MRRNVLLAVTVSLTLLAVLLFASAPWRTSSRVAAQQVMQMQTNPVGSSIAKVRYCAHNSCGRHIDTMMVMAKELVHVHKVMLERTMGPIFVPSRHLISEA
jgi:hypothetical protein